MAALERGFALCKAAQLMEGVGDAAQACVLLDEAVVAFRASLVALEADDPRRALIANQIASIAERAEAARSSVAPAAPSTAAIAVDPATTPAALRKRLDALTPVEEKSLRDRLDSLYKDPEAQRRERESLEAAKRKWMEQAGALGSDAGGGNSGFGGADDLLAAMADEIRAGQREAVSLAGLGDVPAAAAEGDAAIASASADADVETPPAPSEIDRLLALAEAELLVPAAPDRSPGHASSSSSSSSGDDEVDSEEEQSEERRRRRRRRRRERERGAEDDVTEGDVDAILQALREGRL